MKPEAYTLFVASSRKGRFRKITLPGYVLHLVAILAVVGGVTVLAAAGSYTRMLWKVGQLQCPSPPAGYPQAQLREAPIQR